MRDLLKCDRAPKSADVNFVRYPIAFAEQHDGRCQIAR